MEGNDEDSGRVAVGVIVRLWSRGGNDREIEGSGSKIDSGVTVGSERAGGVLESSPSSPTCQIPPFSVRKSVRLFVEIRFTHA